MNDSLKRFTLNIVFEDTNFQKNKVIQSVYNALTGHEGGLDLAKQQINLRPHLFKRFITTLSGLEQPTRPMVRMTFLVSEIYPYLLATFTTLSIKIEFDHDEPVDPSTVSPFANIHQ